MTNPVIESVTQDIIERSRKSRAAYEEKCRRMRDQYPPKHLLSCGNMAHAYAASDSVDKISIRSLDAANLGIINAYNDMLSAHQPLAAYPDIIREAARKNGATAQVAAGVPAMCDGVTQGQAGMELSLFSRDVIALATVIGLSHNVFDGVLCLGVCDKIVPGMMIGALEFGHLPVGFIPAGPMPSGLSNTEKSRVRQQYAANEIDRETLLDAESAAYHSPGTCTFYGTANSNQILMEMLGVQLPGASFVNPLHPLRKPLTQATVSQVINACATDNAALGKVISAQSLVNAVVALMATGGSTNHSLHLVAIARAAGLDITWTDFAAISKVTPLLARIYPNGDQDINAFQDAGGTAFLIKELRAAGLLNEEVSNLMGRGLEAYELRPDLNEQNEVVWQSEVAESSLPEVLRPHGESFDDEGGLKLIEGNLGMGIAKVSAVDKSRYLTKAPCRIFSDQSSFREAFEQGELNCDLVVVIRFQGPQANGMPELHQLLPRLGVLQSQGHQVALVTDGRMSGASGKVPAVVHLCPEAKSGGALAKLRDGDLVEVDLAGSTLKVWVEPAEWNSREPAPAPEADGETIGRGLFARMRDRVGTADIGASIFHD